MTKKQTVELLQQQLPGFYSAEQVIALINGIDESESTKVVGSELQEKLMARVNWMLQRLDRDDVVDMVTAEFGLSGNEIELEHVDVNLDLISETVSEALEFVLADAFPETE